MKAVVIAAFAALLAPAAFGQTVHPQRAPIPPIASLERMHEHGLWGAMGPTPAAAAREAPAAGAPPASPEGQGGSSAYPDMRRMHHGPDASKGARFTFERAGARIEVKCDDDEPMRACVEAAIMLIDKLSASSPAAAPHR